MMTIYAIITLVVIYNRLSMIKINNSPTPFIPKITVITRDGVRKIDGQNVTLNILPSDNSVSKSFISIWAEKDDAIMASPWHPDKKGESFVPSRYFNFFVKTQDQTDEIENTFNHVKNVGNRNFKIEEDEKNLGFFKINVDYSKDEV